MTKKILLFLLVVLATGGLFLYRWFKNVEQKIFISKTTSVVVTKTSEPVYTTIADKLSHSVPFSILLIGYGGSKHDGTYLTDTIMVAHINPKIKKIYLISIPRDLYAIIPDNKTGGTHRKINSAYAIGLDDKAYPNKPEEFTGSDGGGRMAEHLVSEVTGLSIDHFAGIDFSGFIKTIDTLGGVDVKVEKTFDDFAYPLEGKETETCGHSDKDIQDFMATASASFTAEFDYFPCRYEHLHFDAGVVHMTGLEALKFVRSRHSAQDGSDFGRATRQRNLILAVKNEIISVGFLSKILPFMTGLGDDARTDMSLDDVKTILTSAKELNSYQVETLALTDQNYLKEDFSTDGQSILIPRAGQDNYSKIQTWIRETLSGKPQPEEPIVLVQNGTKISGLAARISQQLSDKNIRVLPPTGSSHQDTERTMMTVYGTINPDLLDEIKALLHVNEIQTAQKESTQSYNLRILLGKDSNFHNF